MFTIIHRIVYIVCRMPVCLVTTGTDTVYYMENNICISRPSHIIVSLYMDEYVGSHLLHHDIKRYKCISINRGHTHRYEQTSFVTHNGLRYYSTGTFD